MRPLRIEISGLRSFRATQTVDFTDLGLFAVVGDTGAGKSSILEAMIYALYNACSWSERDVHELIAADSETMKVTFDFSAGGHTYRVTRSRWKAPGRPALHSLRSDTDPSSGADGERAVNTALRRIVGLDYATFCKTVILPQGRFAELLLAKDSDRQRILGDLLGLDEIERLRAALEPAREDAQTLRSRLDGARAELGERLPERLHAARDEASAAQADVRRFDATAAELLAIAPRLREIADRNAEIERVREALRHFDEPIASLGELREREPAITQAIASARARHEAAREAAARTDYVLEALRRDGRDAAELTRQRGIVERLQKERRDVLADAEQNAELAERLASARTAIEEGTRRRTALLERVEAAESVLRDAREAHLAGQEACRHAGAVWRELEAARAAADEADRRLRSAAKQQQGAVATLQRAREEARRAEDAATGAHRAFDEARSANAVAEVARGLHAGDPCPVCVRPLPKTFRPPSGLELEPLHVASDDAERVRRRSLQALASAEAAMQAASVAQDEAKARSDEERRRREEAEAAVRSAGLDPSAADERAATAVLLARRADLAEEERRAQTARDAARTAADRAGAALDERKRGYDTERTAHEASARRLARRRKEWEALRGTIVADYRPALDAADEAIALICAALDEAIAHAKHAESEAHHALLADQDAERAVYAAETQYRREVSDREAAARSRLESAIARIERTLARIELAVPPVRTGEGFAASVAWSAALAAWIEGVRPLLAQRTDAYARDVSALEEQRSSLLSRHGAENEDRFESVRRIAQTTAGAAATRLDALEEALRRATQLDAEREALLPLERALGTLWTYLSGRTFKEWLMRRRESTLLGLGTEILRTMTRGRYAFAARFRIFDGNSGLERSPHTLSGGERFIGSLALALALVEVTSRTGGKIEAMFLDEGFGTLDTRALDEALGELATRASSGHLIGIVTHVRGVAEIIETLLRVRRLPSGTVVERLDPAERDAYLEDELAAGLLSAAGDRGEVA
jgi:DNA repair protein SbcC/Rad50